MAELLLTGATGMVGREVLVRAAQDPRFDRVRCLVRPDADRSAATRLADLMSGSGLADDDGRITAVPGDVRAPGLGVPGRDLRGVTHVIHCAATVAFDHPLDEARRINVAGTQQVLQVCRALPALERLDAVSTCYVAGKRSGLILESDLRHRAGFHNTYEQTKYEAEELLRAAMPDLPIAVHRPSIVVGDSRTGRTGAWKVLYWPLKVIARGWLPVVPYDPDASLDIVPVDFVADALMALSRQPETIGGTYHLAAGPERDTTVAELFRHVFRLMDRRPPLRVPPAVFRRAIRPLLMVVPSGSLHRTLQTGLVYRPYLELRIHFDTSGADAALASQGVAAPAVVDYIDTVVRAALAADFGKRPAP